MTLDTELFYFFNNFVGKSAVFDTLVVFFAEYLQYVLLAAFLLLLYFSGYPRREKLSMLWTTALSSLVARFGINEIIHLFYHRLRPFRDLTINTLSSYEWMYSENGWSFPSGHSAFFFAMAVSIYFYNKKWGAGFFIAALVMNISRVAAGVHYPFDILGGMVVGVLTVYMVFFWYIIHKET